jgi:ABC-type transport system involved in multi-copper enzyme maturation permease subunit
MSVSATRVRAIYRKELREYRRNRYIIGTMAVIPLIFVIGPLFDFLVLPASAASALQHSDFLLILLGIPALVPAVIAAYAVVGEREQGTLEPVLTTPIRHEELLLGKALAALVPSLAVAYAVYAVFLVGVKLFAQPAVASSVLQGPDLLVQVVYTPLLAGWSIWVGIAISTRSSDVRVAQQLSALASLPVILLTLLVEFSPIHATLSLAISIAAVLVVLNGLGWCIVLAAFDRERLVTGNR